MAKQDWLVTENGNCLGFDSPREWDLLSKTNPYRLYRFLEELEDILNQGEMTNQKEKNLLKSIRRVVRKLILNVYWVKTIIPDPCPKTGTALSLLYDEPGFSLTLQTEIMLPGTTTSIHNHGTWGVVATLRGQQKNSFWKRLPTSEVSNKLQKVEEKILRPGDIISFTSNAIHQVEAIGDEPTFTLNLYGETISNRFNFDPITHQAHKF
ncbi:cupin [cyanobacterium endosymbiont of Rhopalodia gibberula]|uniref:cysteine dioxygenase family protein n=1 Tax=cyanobacterium endosymbiont of Rhopalodia gibberula TaxID=1763363 RepID=UPI000E64F307|nr:cupin [cyanobacterium endosymbiont of Rhopalodia gibberula]